ncbi:MAG: YhcH/YjgK/YiaL family protein [Victivallales bacterium]|nr:YhcH/YjgK/YiaL family protein [Victivallales bacterium]
MIYDDCRNIPLFTQFPQEARQAISAFLSQLTLQTPLGKRQLLGDRVTVNVFDSTTKATVDEASSVEIHRAYVDVQTVLSGEEICYCLPVDGLEPRAPFNVQNDYQLFLTRGADLDRAARVTLRPGRCAVFFPGEGHLCCLCLPGQGVQTLRKVVFKIAADSLLS